MTCYLFAAFLGGIVIRTLISFLRTWECRHGPKRDRDGYQIFRPEPAYTNFCCDWWHDFLSTHEDHEQHDYWHPAILGWFELLSYPVLFEYGHLYAIGGWISLKTVANWQEWLVRRESYNRFLIGNALVLTAAYLLFVSGLVPRFLSI